MALNRVPLFACLLLFSGCGSVAVSQLDFARGFVGALTIEEAPLLTEPQFAWVYELNDLQALVYAVQEQDRVVFLGPSTGMRLEFDGLRIVSGERLPNGIQRFEIRTAPDGATVHDIEGVGRFELSCDTAERIEAQTLIRCRHRDSERSTERYALQRLVFDARDNLVLIETTLVPGSVPLRLERVSVPGSTDTVIVD